MPRYAAVLDACVLVPVVLADTLLRVAEKGLYRPLWSKRILTEAREAIEEIHPGIDVHKRFADMDAALMTPWSPAGRDWRPESPCQTRMTGTLSRRRSGEARKPSSPPMRTISPSPLLASSGWRQSTRQDLALLLSRAGVPGFADAIQRLMSAPLDNVT